MCRAVGVVEWGLNQRAYMDTAIKGSPPVSGMTRAAMTPTLLTAIWSSFSSGTLGKTCRNYCTSTRSDSFTTMGQRSQ